MRLSRVLVILRAASGVIAPLSALLMVAPPPRRRAAVLAGTTLFGLALGCLLGGLLLLGIGLYRWLAPILGPAEAAMLTGAAALCLAAILAGAGSLTLRDKAQDGGPPRLSPPPPPPPHPAPDQSAPLLPPRIEDWLRGHPDGVRLAAALAAFLVPERRS